MGRHGWNATTGRWRLTALLGVGITVLALVLTVAHALPRDTEGPGPARDDSRAHGSPDVPRRAGPGIGWGFTHTRHSADEGSETATKRVQRRLAERPMPQIQHIMGWGADNPEPVKGRYDFADLDRRIGFVRATGGTPVVTLCCAPDWMKGGKPGRTDWSQEALERAPDRAHYKDFAALAATVAERYPDVRHFIVWNEFKGFWNDAEDRWDHEGYTELYNLVHKALKNVDEDIAVGGPYLVMDSFGPRRGDNASSAVKGRWGAMDQRVLDAFDHWNRHKAGADFVVVDGSGYTKDGELLPDEFGATEKFTAVSRWVRERTGDLPLWWAEYYVEPADGDDVRDGWSEARRVAVHASALMAMARGGTGSAFYWNPQTGKGAGCAGCLWTPTGRASGGRALPMFGLLSRFGAEFPPGTTTYEPVSVARGDRAEVRVLADDEVVLVVNTLGKRIGVKVDGKRFAMGAYEVKWLSRGSPRA